VLNNEAVGCLISLAESEEVGNAGVEDVLDAEVHPLPEHTPRVINILSAEPNLELLPQVDGLEGVEAGHEDVVAVHIQPLAARLPGDPHLLHLDAHPRHFLLETKVFNDIGRVVACFHGQQDQRLLGYRKQDFLGSDWHLHIHKLPHILAEICPVAAEQVLLVVADFYYLRGLPAGIV
jgi:hypothetical protein